MASITFPSNPTNGQLFPNPAVAGENQYRWSETYQVWQLLGPATTVDPGTYGDSANVAQFTVNAQGELTFARSVPISSSAGGTVTSIITGAGLTGGPITSSGTISLLPATSGTIGGVYPDGTSITVDGSGRISVINSGGATLQGVTDNGDITTNVITVGGLISNGAILPGAHEVYDLGSITQAWRTLYVKSTSIYLGPYKLSVVDGKLTIDGTVTGSGTVTDITAGVGLSGGTITTSGTIDLAPATTSTLGGVIADGTSILISPTGVISAVGDGTGTVTSITAGTGLTGGTITTSGTINLANTAVVPGTYNLATVEVDAQGRITYAQSGVFPSSVQAIIAGTGINVVALDPSFPNVSLANTAVTPGSYTYGSFTVDQQGRLTAASSGVAPVTSVTGTGPISVTTGTTPAVSIAAASTTQSGAVQLNDTVTSTSVTQAATANAVKTAYDVASAAMPVAGGTFTGDVSFNPGTSLIVDPGANFTMDGQGYFSGSTNFEASSTTTFISGSALNLNGTVTFGETPTYSSGVDIGPAAQVTYASTSGLTATNVQDALDELATGACQGTVTSITAGTGLSGGTITSSGTIALADTAVCAGSYTNASITVDAQGRITAASSGSSSSGTVTCIATGTGLSGGPITSNGTIALCAATAYCLGGVIGFSTVSSSNVTLGYDAGSLLGSGGGTGNVILGRSAGGLVSSGSENVYIGASAGLGNGSSNIAIGSRAISTLNSPVCDSIAIGNFSMSTASGCCNIAIGPNSMGKVTGTRNTALGNGALTNATSADNNIGIGYQAFLCLTTGINNTEIGANNGLTNSYSPPFTVTNQCNRLVVGSSATTNAYVQVAWTVISDERDKTEIQPIALGLDFVSQLEPISYRFKESRDSDVAVGMTRYGFSAQKVLKVEGDNPVIVDVEDPDKLKITDSSMIPVLVKAIQELKAELDAIKNRD